MRSRDITVAVVTALFLISGCGQGSGEESAAGSPTPPPTPEHLVADTGVEGQPVMREMADYAFDVVDPASLAKNSALVVSGTVIGVERSFVSANADIVTAYSVQVETVYKGEKVADVISVRLPGGTVPLGEYIQALDKLGLHEMKLGSKDLDRDGEPDGGDGGYQDPRTMDPMVPISENWGLNPTSEKTLAEVQPELWVFYIGGSEDGSYYGTAFDYSLKYLKDGLVHSLDTETKVAPYPEAELSRKR